jgi:hypothetical protein
MSKLDEAIQQLAEAKAKVMANQADLNAVQANKEALKAEVVEIEKKIADAKKPKLRHGEVRAWTTDHIYGIPNSDLAVTLDLSAAKPFIIFNSSLDGTPVRTSYSIDDIHKLSYHVSYPFDDLKAIVEPLTEFKMESSFGFMDIEVSIRRNSVRLKDKDGYLLIRVEDLSEFILNLRRLQHTLKVTK